MPAGSQVTLVIDRQNRKLIKFGVSVISIPDLSQRDSVALLIQIADPPSNSISGSPTIITTTAISGGSPRVTLSSKATPDAGDQATWQVAGLYESGFTWDPTQNGFTGLLNLNTTQLQTFMVNSSDAESVIVEFEVRWNDGSGNLSTLLPGPKNKVTIWANDDEGLTPPVSLIGIVPTYNLPVQFRAASGSVYVLSEVSPGGGLTFNLLP